MKTAKQYCDEMGFPSNEHGAFMFHSSCGKHKINLQIILEDFALSILEFPSDQQIEAGFNLNSNCDLNYTLGAKSMRDKIKEKLSK